MSGDALGPTGSEGSKTGGGGRSSAPANGGGDHSLDDRQPRSAGAETRGPVGELWATIRRELWSPAVSHFPTLDGIRAIAILLVIGFHSKGFLSSGWVGVDLFFALSGFLIGRILLEQLAEGRINFRAFYVRRIFRIFPAYYTVLSLQLAARLWLSSRSSEWATLLGSVPNYAYISNYTYGTGWEAQSLLGWGWSLCIEEHFYLLTPVLLSLLISRLNGRRRRVVVLCALAFVPALLRLAAYVRDPRIVAWDRLYPNSHTHFDGLWCGVLIAYGYVYHRVALQRWSLRLRHLMWVVAFACLAAVHVWGGLWRTGIFPTVAQFLVLGIGSSLLILNGLFLENWLSRLLGYRGWYPLARLSYGVYLVHPFVVFGIVTCCHGVLASGSILLAATVTVLANASAAILFLTVERPMLERGAQLSRTYSKRRAAAC
jgi:peptidoglycan/LPS O-acetylase OafA/YrhL